MKKIFLGGLPKSVTDEKLRDLFCGFGEIIDFVVMKDTQTKESRGFGFIEYSSEEPVNEVLRCRPHIIENREIEVRRAMPKDITHSTIHERTKRVFIGGLNYDVTEEALQNYYNDKFVKYGKVESVEVKRDRETNQSRGFGFITFDSEDTVDVVLIIEPKPSLFGRNCEVKKSEPRRTDDTSRFRRGSRFERFERRRSPVESRERRRYDEDDYRRTPPKEYSRHRPSRYSREPYPAQTYNRDYTRERSPPRPDYRSYHQDSPAVYPDPPSYDRSYSYSSYPEYPNSYPSQGTNSGYSKSPTPRMPTSSGYAPRTIPPPFNPRTPSTSYRQFEPGYRDYENNPY